MCKSLVQSDSTSETHVIIRNFIERTSVTDETLQDPSVSVLTVGDGPWSKVIGSRVASVRSGHCKPSVPVRGHCPSVSVRGGGPPVRYPECGLRTVLVGHYCFGSSLHLSYYLHRKSFGMFVAKSGPT